MHEDAVEPTSPVQKGCLDAKVSGPEQVTRKSTCLNVMHCLAEADRGNVSEESALCIAGVPLSRHKQDCGGRRRVLGRICCRVGTAQRRAEWFIRWTGEAADSRTVNMLSFEEGLIQKIFVVGTLQNERPFLGPLHRFLSVHFRGPAISLRCEDGELGYSDGRTGIRGWWRALAEVGRPAPKKSPWYSVELNKENWPWVYEEGGERDNRSRFPRRRHSQWRWDRSCSTGREQD